ncbi:Ycf49-like protein [Chlorella vulgaris]
MSLQQCAAPRSALARSCALQAAPTRSVWLRSGPRRQAPPGRHAATRRHGTRHHAPETHSTAPVRRRTLQRVDTPNAAASQLLTAGTVAAAAIAVLLAAGPALAFEVHTEPANALSLPTWAVHTSSVLEWITAMGLMWRYGEVSGNPRWKGMAWGMLPCLGSAMCACTWHLFYNSEYLQFLVALQAGLTVVGNFTCWWAAYRIYQGAQPQQG